MPTKGDGTYAVRLREDAAGWRRISDDIRLTPDDPVLEGLTEQEAEDLLMSQWALVAHEPDESSDGDAVESWANWNEDDWLDIGYTQRADDVRAGRVDDYLDDIEEVETSQTVTDAVEQRRDELTLDEE